MRRRNLWCIFLAMALSLVWGCAGMDYVSVATIAVKTTAKAVEASRPISDSE